METCPVKKGDVAAIVTTTLTHFGFGSGRAPEKHHSIAIVRVESATKEGALKSYRNSPRSPVYKYENRYARHKVLTIAGEPQANARRLFDGAADYHALHFDTQEAAIAAIRAA